MNKQDVIRMIENGEWRFIEKYPEWGKDKDVVKLTIKKAPQYYGDYILNSINRSLYEDEEIVTLIIEKFSGSLKYITKNKNEKLSDKLIKKAIAKSACNFQYAPDYMKDDKEIALRIIKKNNSLFNAISQRLKGDKEILEIAIVKSPEVIEYASDELKNDKNIALSCVNKNGSTICFFSEMIKKDKDVALAAVQQNGAAFLFIQKYHNDCKIRSIAFKNEQNLLQNSSLSEINKNDFFNILCHTYYLFLDSKYEIPYSSNITNCLNSHHFTEEFFEEIKSNTFYSKHALSSRLCDLRLCKAIALQPNFLPSVEIIQRGKKNINLKEIYEAKEAEWTARLENRELTKSFASRKELVEEARKDTNYFKKISNPFVDDIDFIIDVLESGCDINRVNKKIIENSDFIMKVIAKIPETIAYLEKNIKDSNILQQAMLQTPGAVSYSSIFNFDDLHKIYGDNFLKACLESKDEKAIQFGLAFDEFCLPYLFNNPEWIPYSNYTYQDLLNKTGDKFYSQCFNSSCVKAQQFVIFESNYMPTEEEKIKYKGQKDIRGAFVEGNYREYQQENIVKIKP